MKPILLTIKRKKIFFPLLWLGILLGLHNPLQAQTCPSGWTSVASGTLYPASATGTATAGYISNVVFGGADGNLLRTNAAGVVLNFGPGSTSGLTDEDDADPDYVVVAPSVCSISAIAAAPTCTPATNNYNLIGSITFINAPTTGTLTISMGGVTQVFNAPFTSPQTYTLSGLTADGASHAVTAVFSASATCTNTVNYTAPVSCVGCKTPNCVDNSIIIVK